MVAAAPSCDGSFAMAHEHDACPPGEHEHDARRLAAKVSDHAVERASAIFRALGDEGRLRLLARLSDGEWCVSELADAAGVGLSTVSQQLRLLRAERLVKRRRAGKHMYYALLDDHVAALIKSTLDHADEAHGPEHDEDATDE